MRAGHRFHLLIPVSDAVARGRRSATERYSCNNAVVISKAFGCTCAVLSVNVVEAATRRTLDLNIAGRLAFS